MSTNLKSIKVDFTSVFVKIRVIRGLFLFLFLNAVALPISDFENYSKINIKATDSQIKLLIKSVNLWLNWGEVKAKRKQILKYLVYIINYFIFVQ